MGMSNRAKADDRNEQQNPLLGLWDLTIPVQPAVGLPVPLLYKYAISEGGYVATGNYDTDANFNGGFTYSATMGTYARTNFPNSYRLRERSSLPVLRWSPATGKAGPALARSFSTT